MTGRSPHTTCISGKARYRDELAAKLALARIDVGHGNRHECRAYRCPACRGWHLTSRP
ncbi:hypothetical protein ACFUJR_14945 [Streptomyces sp. NPDC057271]|uniref:hypothetical protein n=1 Tax=unclassified Streptomyces TaxID=2593676 RepID=UPI00363DB7BB